MPNHRGTGRLIVLGVLSWTAAGCSDSKPMPVSSTRASANAAPTTPSAAQLTLDYWNGLISLPSQFAAEKRAEPKRQVAARREMAAIIRGVPILGVDPDLVNWAYRMASLQEERADLIENSHNPLMLIEAFARGVNGDPLGVTIELSQAERAWVANCRAMNRELHQLRATLTARYGVEFPR